MAAWNIACWLSIGPLLAPVVPGGWRFVIVVASLPLVAFLLLARGLTGGAYPSPMMRVGVYRPFWYIELLLPLLAIAGLLGAVLGLPFGAAGRGGRWAMAIATVVLGGLAVVGYFGSRRLAARRIEFDFAHLPPEFDGLCVAQLSDLHVGPHTSRRHLARVAEVVRSADPDLIVYTGDQVDDYARDVEPFGDAFALLTAPLGVFAIAGNHDIFAGWSDVRRDLEGMGITVLVNEALPIRRGGARIWVAGAGDPAGNGWARGGGAEAAPDLDRVLRGVPTEEFALVLAHNPVLWPGLVERGADLTLSGHTHYGQFSIPWLRWNLAGVFLDHSMESYREPDGAALYINPGTNYWGIPLRIGHPAEVTLVTLRRSAREERRARGEAVA